MANELRDLLQRYQVTLIVMCAVAVIGLWPVFLAPLGRMYVLLCGSLPADVPFGHHYPPLLVAFIVPIVLALLIAGLIAGIRQVEGQRRLSASLMSRRWCPGDSTSQAIRALAHSRDVIITSDREIYAFCGGLFRPRIYLSRGVLNLLDEDEIDALLRHERHHVRHRDPSRIFVASLLRGLAPVLPVLETFDQWVRVKVELAADRAALAGQPPEVLANTMLKVMRGLPATDHTAIVTELSPTEARIAALRGKPVNVEVNRLDVFLSGLMLVECCLVIAWLAHQALPNPPFCAVCPAF